MMLDKRDGGPAPQGRRIPIPPAAVPPEKVQPVASTKSGILSPRTRPTSGMGIGRGKDATSSAILSAPNFTKQRTPRAPIAIKLGKPTSRPNSSRSVEDKDDIRQRDNSFRKDSLARDKAIKDSIPRRHGSGAESANLTDAGKRLLLKNTAAPCPVTSPNGKAMPDPSSSKPVPRSFSSCRDRLVNGAMGANEPRTNQMRRSMSVGKGRILANQADQAQVQAAHRTRPPVARVNSACSTGAPYRQVAEKRDLSAGRLRPLSATSGKSDMSITSSSKSALTTITEAPARPAPHPSVSTGSTVPKPVGPPRPMLSLNLAALKSQPATSGAPVEPCISPCPEDQGPPVPKLDLGGILQRRAEEQASEPVFMVAASNDDIPEPPGSSAYVPQLDKRKSGSRQTSAKEEPAEHFYLYPKVNPQEKKRIEDICRVVPKKQQAAITDLFSKMVEARQNCEQMCFRGHRLLDQAQAEFKSRLAQKEEEAAQWRQEAEFLRTQLAMLLTARQQEENVGEPAAPLVQNQPEGGEEDRAAFLRRSVLSTFDSMAQLGLATSEAYGGDGQGDADG
ncbi:hypothetical protein Vretimale_663 [Volvox reticuliferus]|uniref:Uncharacterized protein n=1 Tax=Volvox reticuliferus TaxID=1737510 RepID=A0A8J4G101_9CHLO|nr:hypothetical protein Vretifemale_2336 [Volvox reticuliferus]GIL94465.1 hypothetical protein Vretimale_663 [Volvox reticuliferus]